MAMSRRTPINDFARFNNVTPVQADCLKIETYPDLKEVDAIVHSVGSITDLVNYKKLL
mgnify:CR=1 FL=1